MLLPKELNELCISKKYAHLEAIVAKQYTRQHPMFEDLVQEAAMAYQEWLCRIDSEKIHNPFSSAVKKAMWRVSDVVRNDSRKKHGLCMPMETDFVDSLTTNCNENPVEENFKIYQASCAILDKMYKLNDQQIREFDELFFAQHTGQQPNTMTDYTKSKYKKMLKTLFCEHLETSC
jgi:hypothetical protein